MGLTLTTPEQVKELTKAANDKVKACVKDAKKVIEYTKSNPASKKDYIEMFHFFAGTVYTYGYEMDGVSLIKIVYNSNQEDKFILTTEMPNRDDICSKYWYKSIGTLIVGEENE